LALPFLALLSIVAWHQASAQNTPAGYRLVPAFAPLSFTQPLLLIQAPDDAGRWYVVEQPGTIRTFRGGDPQSTLFADLSARILSGGERGLLGMAFHPDYPEPPTVFLSYTAGGDGHSVISRFTVNSGGLTLDPLSETILLQQPQPFANHNGGNIVFGPDGFLYIGLGDGGSANDPQNNAQDTTTLLGSLLRIDVDGGEPYAIPPDNPFAGSADCTTGCPEIYAWGLRNPWRFSFDTGSPTSELWLGDVGQDAWEEVDKIVLGGNYGWPCLEGNNVNANTVDPTCLQPPTFIAPVAEYPQTAGDCSVTGGYVYRGSLLPELVGRYIFGDFCTGRVWAVVGDGSTGQFELLLSTGRNISSFGQDRDGEIYVVDLAGVIHQLRHRVPGRGLPWLSPLLLDSRQ
jgi:glucose/arabinose dehydrogenase